jgi:hypothetical protein
MPGLPGDNGVEAPAGGVPVLELRHLDTRSWIPTPTDQPGHVILGMGAEHLGQNTAEDLAVGLGTV